MHPLSLSWLMESLSKGTEAELVDSAFKFMIAHLGFTCIIVVGFALHFVRNLNFRTACGCFALERPSVCAQKSHVQL